MCTVLARVWEGARKLMTCCWSIGCLPQAAARSRRTIEQLHTRHNGWCWENATTRRGYKYIYTNTSPPNCSPAPDIPDMPHNTASQLIRSLGVVGAGQMGSGIALLAALHDVPVTLHDVSTMALSKGKDAMAASLQRLIKSGKANADTRDATLARVQTTVSLQVHGHLASILQSHIPGL